MHSVRLTGATMGTTYNLTLVSETQIDNPSALQAEVDGVLKALNQQVSTYIPDSEINRLKQRPINEWLDISTSMEDVLSVSLTVSDWSAGAFDVTLRPLIDLWGFGPSESLDQVPASKAVDDALSRIGFEHLRLDTEQHKLMRTAAVDLDFSAVAKGYGVDRVASVVEQHGITNYLLEIGGEIRLRGRNAKGKVWTVAVERPQDSLSQQVYKAIALTDIAMATSGDYRNYFEQDGERYSHTIDPRTGRPIVHNLASVTVLHSSAAMADALATAFNVMGVEQARPLANSKGIAALFIIKTESGFSELASDAFKPYLSSAVVAP
ncbi:MAG: FAD:protein FMN transferase [Cellvibrionaceae bacterium]